jgi:hypothetical protein
MLRSFQENLECPEILQLLYERNLIQVSPYFTTILIIYIAIVRRSFEAERTLNYQK